VPPKQDSTESESASEAPKASRVAQLREEPQAAATLAGQMLAKRATVDVVGKLQKAFRKKADEYSQMEGSLIPEAIQ
jgi:hypothetical protein